jgi:hypothetical protein
MDAPDDWLGIMPGWHGSLTVKASYEVASDERVDIKFIESTLVGETVSAQLRCLMHSPPYAGCAIVPTRTLCHGQCCLCNHVIHCCSSLDHITPHVLFDDVWFLQVPEKLQSLFQANYDLLLSIFNPEGWLDITYVDQDTRVGRDDKGNIFVLARAHDNNGSSGSSS